MVKHLVSAAALLLAAAALTDARAAEQCFCLAHPTGGITQFGCDAKQIPNGTGHRVTCRKDNKSYEMNVIEHPERFTRVEAGVGACNPCNPPLRVVPVDLPRRPGEAPGQ